MFFLYFILLTFTFINANPTDITFLTKFQNDINKCQILSKTNFTNILQDAKLNCNFHVPDEVPKFKVTDLMSLQMHYCIGIYDSAKKLCDQYQDPRVNADAFNYFNRSIEQIVSEIRKTDNLKQILCENFNQYDNASVEVSPWLKNIREKFSDLNQCRLFCIDGDDIAIQCLLMYEINKKLHEFQYKTQNSEPEQPPKVVENESYAYIENKPGYHMQVPDQNLQSSDASKIPNTASNNAPMAAQTSENSPQKEVAAVTNKESEVANGINYHGVVNPSSSDIYVAENDEGDNRFQKPSVSSSTPQNSRTSVTASVSSGIKVEQSSSTVIKKPETPLAGFEQPIPDLKNDQKTINVESDFVEDEDLIPPNVSPIQGDKLPSELSKDDRMQEKDFSEPLISKLAEQNSVTEKRLSSTLYVQQVDSEVSLMPWYLMVIFCIFLVYLSFANKKKIVAYVVEGRPGSRSNRRSRPNTANYRKLDSNLEEAITSNCSTTTSHVIY